VLLLLLLLLQAAGVILNMIKEGKIAGRAVLLAGQPGTGAAVAHQQRWGGPGKTCGKVRGVQCCAQDGRDGGTTAEVYGVLGVMQARQEWQ
jgi:hypothetical protein